MHFFDARRKQLIHSLFQKRNFCCYRTDRSCSSFPADWDYEIADKASRFRFVFDYKKDSTEWMIDVAAYQYLQSWNMLFEMQS